MDWLDENRWEADVILLQVEQIGGIACHAGRRRCFFAC